MLTPVQEPQRQSESELHNVLKLQFRGDFIRYSRLCIIHFFLFQSYIDVLNDLNLDSVYCLSNSYHVLLTVRGSDNLVVRVEEALRLEVLIIDKNTFLSQ